MEEKKKIRKRRVLLPEDQNRSIYLPGVASISRCQEREREREREREIERP